MGGIRVQPLGASLTEQALRLFVSSPGDVPDERRRVDLVVERLNAASLALDGRVKPDSLQTNWSALARISSSVAGGLKLCSVLVFRHIASSPENHAE
jgi:hypothetical protein